MGKDPRYLTVFNLYRARFVQEMFKIWHESYWARARTGSYQGLTWAPLKKYTVKIKREIEESGNLDENSIRRDFYEWYGGYKENLDAIKHKHRRMLEPEQRERFEKTYRAELKAGKTRSRAEANAWTTLSSPPREFAKLIGIRTGRLVAATAPGEVKNNRYYPNEDQEVEITTTLIKFNVNKVPHAKAFDEGISEGPGSPLPRPLLPNDLTGWMLQAHEAIIAEVNDFYLQRKAYWDAKDDELKARKIARELAKTPIKRLRARTNNRSAKKRVRNSTRRKRS